jgi:endonuclease YncB( thermonuclease family)
MVGVAVPLVFAAVVAIASLEPYEETPTDVVWVTVDRVIDGDTIVVNYRDGGQDRVRLIGVDTPEEGDCWADDATSWLRDRVDGRPVALEPEGPRFTEDRWGRVLAHVWHADQLVAAELVRRGHGVEYLYDVPSRHRARILDAEDKAQADRMGVWGCPR